MTESEQAKKLVDYYWQAIGSPILTENNKPLLKEPKLFANITADYIIKELAQLRKPEYTTFVTSYKDQTTSDGYERIDFWGNVKTEINKL